MPARTKTRSSRPTLESSVAKLHKSLNSGLGLSSEARHQLVAVCEFALSKVGNNVARIEAFKKPTRKSPKRTGTLNVKMVLAAVNTAFKGGLGTAEKRRKLQTKCLQESSRLNQVLAEKEAELTQVNRELAQKRKQLEALGPERGGKAAASSRAVCAKAGHGSEPAAAADRRQPRVLLGLSLIHI